MATSHPHGRKRIGLACLAVAALVLSGCAFLQPAPETLREPQIQTRGTSIFADLEKYVIVTAKPGDSFDSLAATHLQNASLGWMIADINGIDSFKPGQALVIPLVPLERCGLSPGGRQTVPILTYHKLSENGADAVTVTRKAFDDQMLYLKNHGYKVISLDDFFDFLELKEPLPRKSVVITFDDGWRSTYDIAFPILKKYGYPSTLFVYTDFVSEGGGGMTWAILREMQKGGVSIQSHTKSHRYLNKLSGKESFRAYFDAIWEELDDSAKIIRKHLNTDIKYLAYPYGETSDLVAALAQKTGYRGALTVERDGNSCFVSPYRVHRSMIYGNFDLEDFEKNLKIFNHQELK